MEQNINILIADANDDFRLKCRERLRDYGYGLISEARDGEDALSKIGNSHPDVVIVDSWLPKLDGIKLIKALQNGFPISAPQSALFLLITRSGLSR